MVKNFMNPVYPIVAKVEDAADPRRQGRSRSELLRTLGNKGDAVSSAFPKGKKHDKFLECLGIHFKLIPENVIYDARILNILVFSHSLPCFLCNYSI